MKMKIKKRNGGYRVQPMRNGKRYSLTFDHKPTKADVECALADAISKEKSANGIDMTLRTASVKYIQSKENVLSPTTIKGYDKMHRNMPEWIMEIKLNELTQEHLNRLVNELAIDKAPKTVRNYHGYISAILSVYRPSMNITTHLPQKVKKDVYIPSDEDIRAILSELKGTKYYVPIILLSYGLRRSELFAITADDVDGDCIHINKALVKDKDNKVVVKTTKTTESTRDIYVPQYVADYIKENGSAIDESPETLFKVLSYTQARLGIPHFSPHKLRHYYASKLHDLGYADQDIMSLGGWKSDHVLKNIYRHSLNIEEKKRSASKQLQSALF